MTEKISILVITRNRAEMLAGCLKSLVGQTLKPNEVIVVDNASEDNTKKVILSFKKSLPIKYVRVQQIGIPYARNKGIQEASGSLLLMIDDDCKADKSWVERMANAHKKYPKAWVIQGRTFSLPKDHLYSLLAEFHRFLSLQKYAERKQPLKVKNFFSKDFRNEIQLSTCDTKNFSIKTLYLKKYKLSFDKDFYRGSDSDFGRQIVQKNGLIMFCPQIQVSHMERPSLKLFLEQRWHIGRTGARIANKWKRSPVGTNISWLEKLLIFLLFCKVSSQPQILPILMALFFLGRLYYLNGWFYERRILSLGKH